MRLWRKSQQEPVEAAPAEPAQPQGGEQGEPQGPDPRLPGTAGYPIGKLPKGKRRHMPPNRFTFVRPDGRED